MKKLILILGMMLLLVGCMACGKSSNQVSGDVSDSETVERVIEQEVSGDVSAGFSGTGEDIEMTYEE